MGNFFMMELIRLSEENENFAEALKGFYGNVGEKTCSITIIKSLVFVNLFKGATLNNYIIPEVYDGFIICSDGSFIDVTNSKLTCSLNQNVSGFGILKMKKNI